MIETTFLNTIKVHFEGIYCIITIRKSGEILKEEVGCKHYGLIPYLVGEMQTNSLEAFLDEILLKITN